MLTICLLKEMIWMISLVDCLWNSSHLLNTSADIIWQVPSPRMWALAGHGGGHFSVPQKIAPEVQEGHFLFCPCGGPFSAHRSTKSRWQCLSALSFQSLTLLLICRLLSVGGHHVFWLFPVGRTFLDELLYFDLYFNVCSLIFLCFFCV